MKLAAYLRHNDISDEQFAEKIGASEGAVRKWKSGERTPRPDAMLSILAATSGKVTPNDFLPSQSAPATMAEAS